MGHAVMEKSKEGLTRWLTYAPVLVCVAVMLPRLLNPQFGLLDDGVMLSISRQITSGQMVLGSAGNFRSLAFYWLYYAATYLLAGQNPLVFFLGNLLVFMTTTAVLISLVRRIGGSRWQAFAAGLLFTLAGPVFENYYTLSKGEGVQVLFTLLSLWFFLYFFSAKATWKKVLSLVGTILALSLGVLAKETTVALVPIGVAWSALPWFIKPLRPARPERVGRIVYGLLILGVCTVYLLLGFRIMANGIGGIGQNSFYNFNISRIINTLPHWTILLAHDYSALVPLGFFILVIGFAHRPLPLVRFYLDALVWMAAWIIIFLPWLFTFEYYTLPFAAGYAVFGGLATGELIKNLPRVRLPGKIFATTCLILAILSVVATLPNNITNAHLQLAIDDANTELLTYLARIIPPGGKLYFNLLPDNEYIFEANLHFPLLYGRKDIAIGSFLALSENDRAQLKPPYAIIAPSIDNQPYATVRLGSYSLYTRQWNQALQDFMHRPADKVIVRSFHRFNIDLVRLPCPFLAEDTSVCSQLPPIIDLSPVSYSWEIYLVNQ